MSMSFLVYFISSKHSRENKPENQDEDALGKIEQQQNCVILERRPQLKWVSTCKAKYFLNLNFKGHVSLSAWQWLRAFENLHGIYA